MEYNGWTNYETWVVKLWIDNNEDQHHHWQEQAQLAIEHMDTAESDLASVLREAHESSIPPVDGWAGDLLSGALFAVNWHEIAGALIADRAETA
jgi:hypothetical protein